MKKIFISYAVFMIVWFLWGFTNFDFLGEYVSWAIGVVSYAICFPVFASVMIKTGKTEVSLSEMIKNKPNLKILFASMIFALLYNSISFAINKSGYGTDMKLYDLVVTVLTVGFFEEMLFRGWFMNSLMSIIGGVKANFVSSAMFVLLHCPSWIRHGMSIRTMIPTGIMMYALSLLFGLCFKKTKSIWTGAIFHSFWDMITFIL